MLKKSFETKKVLSFILSVVLVICTTMFSFAESETETAEITSPVSETQEQAETENESVTEEDDENGAVDTSETTDDEASSDNIKKDKNELLKKREEFSKKYQNSAIRTMDEVLEIIDEDCDVEISGGSTKYDVSATYELSNEDVEAFKKDLRTYVEKLVALSSDDEITITKTYDISDYNVRVDLLVPMTGGGSRRYVMYRYGSLGASFCDGRRYSVKNPDAIIDYMIEARSSVFGDYTDTKNKYTDSTKVYEDVLTIDLENSILKYPDKNRRITIKESLEFDVELTSRFNYGIWQELGAKGDILHCTLLRFDERTCVYTMITLNGPKGEKCFISKGGDSSNIAYSSAGDGLGMIVSTDYSANNIVENGVWKKKVGYSPEKNVYFRIRKSGVNFDGEVSKEGLKFDITKGYDNYSNMHAKNIEYEALVEEEVLREYGSVLKKLGGSYESELQEKPEEEKKETTVPKKKSDASSMEIDDKKETSKTETETEILYLRDILILEQDIENEFLIFKKNDEKYMFRIADDTKISSEKGLEMIFEGGAKMRIRYECNSKSGEPVMNGGYVDLKSFEVQIDPNELVPTERKPHSWETEKEELKKYDIMHGDEDGAFREEDNITRAEIAAVTCRMLGVDEENEKAEAVGFEDVADNHWASGYIENAQSLGILNGYGDGTFMPDNNITYEEAIKIFVTSLGYGERAMQLGGYPTGYLKVAEELSLSEEIEFSPTDFASRVDIAHLAAKTINIPIYGQEIIMKDILIEQN